MTNQLLYLTFLWFTISCGLSQSEKQELQGASTLDTLTVFDVGSFSECSKVSKRSLVFDMIKPIAIVADISSGNGIVYRKEFLRKDSVFIKFLFENIKFYDEDIMFRSSEGLTNNIVFHDTLLEKPNYRMSKSFAIEGEQASLNYVVFDSFGYIHLNIIDKRKIPFAEKVKNIERIFSSMRNIKIPVTTSQVIGKIDSLKNLNECHWCVENFCQFILSLEEGNSNEVFVLVDPDDFSLSIELDIAASCIVNTYGFQSKFKYISLVSKKSLPNTFKRLAKFTINNCLTKYEEECEVYNYVDCTWLDPVLTTKLRDSLKCANWNQIVKDN